MTALSSGTKGAQAPFSIPEPLPTEPEALQVLIEQAAPSYLRFKLLKTLARQGVSPSFLKLLKKALTKTRQKAAKHPENLYFDLGLPINQRKEDILRLIRENQVVVIAGETGSGKTTQIPKLCLQAGLGVRGMIGCTQPRRLAARAVAQRLAEECGTQLGEGVGYQVRFHDQVRPDSYIKVMTDGILLAEIQQDRFLAKYDTIIIDEAHERSLNIDFLLGYLKQLLPKRPDLKVIITSATIDTEAFSRHFDKAPVIEVSGRTYPVEVRYRPLEVLEDDAGNRFEPTQTEGILAALEELAEADPFGDVLVFLVGEREIKETAEAIRKQGLRHTEVLPLFARQSATEQQKIFQPNPHKRRVILATNVAETSLTVPGIKFVIDTGLVRISRYSPSMKVLRLPIEKISQASANQRKGRCGRVSEGICIRLYSEEDFLARPAFTDPEIKRTSLASAILQMKQLNLGEIDRFPFIDPPEPRMVKDGLKALHEINALDEKGRLTPVGRQVAKLPVDPHFARMIIEAEKNGVLAEMLVVVAALSIQDPREINEQNRTSAMAKHAKWTDPRSDVLFFIHLWHFFEYQKRHLSQNKLRKLCRTNALSYLRMREWHDLFMQLRTTLKQMGKTVPDLHPLDACQDKGELEMHLSDLHALNLHKSLLAGLLGQIALRDEGNSYLGARNTRIYIHPSSVLFKQKPKWLVSAELVETSKLWARTNAPIDVRWVEPVAGHLVKRSYQDPHWEARRGQVGAYENVTLYGLPLVSRRKVNYGPLNPKDAHEIFLRALAEGQVRTKVPAVVHNERLRRQLARWEHKIRRPDLLIGEDALYAFYKTHIPESIYSQPAFEKWYRGLDKAAQQALFLEEAQLLKRPIEQDWHKDFPDQIAIDNQLLKVRYQFAPGEALDGVTFRIPLENLSWLSAQRFEFLTPGLLAEKVTAYLKALPGQLRKRLVPVPQTAAKLAQQLNPEGDLPFKAQLQQALQRHLGMPLEQPLAEVTLSAHLKPKFEIIDRQGKVIARGEDLDALKAQLKHQLEKLATSRGKPAQAWCCFEEALPEQVEQKSHGQRLVLYPALQVTEQGVVPALFPNPEAAQTAHVSGVQALLLQVLKEKYEYLFKTLPLKQACLIYAPYGSCETLKRQVIVRALERCVSNYGVIRTPAAFEQAVEQAKTCWVEQAQRLARQVDETLKHLQALRKKLKRGNPRWLHALSDIQQQLESLIGSDFVANTPEPWFSRLPVYFKGIEKRLEKLELNPQKDQQLQAEFKTVAEQVAQFMASHGEQAKTLRWWLEELRLQMFAQPIKTIQPVSTKRLEKMMAEIQRGG